MINLSLVIGGSGRGNPDRALRAFIELTLKTSAAFTPDKAKTDTIGRWASESQYLGRETDGTYTVKNVRLPDCPDAQKWSRGCPTPVPNPVGFFFVAKAKEPTLILEGFEPLKLKVDANGDGTLLNAKDSSRQYVEWTVLSV